MEEKEKYFEKMVRGHKDTIYTVCYMFSKDGDEVADLFQETLINVWKGLAALNEEPQNLRGWIYRIALNTCITSERRKRSRPTVPLTMDINLFGDPVQASPRERHAELLHRRISRLQPFDRALVLLWLEDISYDEIGQIMGITAKNVSVRLVRIREQLKRMSND